MPSIIVPMQTIKRGLIGLFCVKTLDNSCQLKAPLCAAQRDHDYEV